MFEELKIIMKWMLNCICKLLLVPAFCRPKRLIKKEHINKILLINLQGIGDILMTTPFISALKKEFPNTDIDYCAYKNNATLIEKDPRINTIIKRKEGNLLSIDFLKTLITIRKSKYDLMINLYHAQHSALLTILSNAPYKMGNLHNSACTTNNLAVLNSKKTRDVRKNAKHVAEQLGIPDYDETELSIHQVKVKKKKKQKTIGINPNASWQAKTWPKEHWISLIKKIQEQKKYKKFEIVLIGGPQDTNVAKEIEKATKVTNKAGKLTLKQLASEIQQMSLFITADSGPLQIAVATKTKTIGLYGVTDPERIVGNAKNVTILSTYNTCPKKWKYNHNNAPLKEAQAQIAKITPNRVMEAVEKILK